MQCVRHRSASGSLGEGWEFSAPERSILLNVRDGSVVHEFTVEICARERLVFGAHPIVRISDEEWSILPERVVRVWPGRVERLETIRCPVRASLGMRGIALTNTPASVSCELEAL